MLTFWRRSIQARVVASTLLLSALVVGVVGWVLLSQTRDGLLEQRVSAVIAEANSETADARDRLGAVLGTDTDVNGQQIDLAQPIIQRGQTRGFDVVLAAPEDGLQGSGGATYTPGLDRAASVPASLREHLAGAEGPSWTYTTIVREDAAGGETREPGVVVGTHVVLPADGQEYTLYFLFPLTEQERTLGLLVRAILTAGGLLLLLVAGVALLVTRQVVTPIRLARQVAERLAAGQLQERLVVAGEDDLARLGSSFNQMASALQKQIRRLEELSRVQQRFVSDVSHELRTPLTTVRMATDVLYDARERFDPATARSAELLMTELDRFESLLGDLLEISRFDAGAAQLAVERVDLVELARRVVATTAPLADQRGVDLAVLARQPECEVQGDGRRIERIVRNLVTNAIDHAQPDAPDPRGRLVLVTVSGDETAGALTVRDHGVGLAPAEVAMVFHRFWRADPARARTSGGTGLGLSIALEDAHLHGGWLQAWGRPGEGAQFRLTLPRIPGVVLQRSPLPLVPLGAQPAESAAAGRPPGEGA